MVIIIFKNVGQLIDIIYNVSGYDVIVNKLHYFNFILCC